MDTSISFRQAGQWAGKSVRKAVNAGIEQGKKAGPLATTLALTIGPAVVSSNVGYAAEPVAISTAGGWLTARAWRAFKRAQLEKNPKEKFGLLGKSMCVALANVPIIAGSAWMIGQPMREIFVGIGVAAISCMASNLSDIGKELRQKFKKPKPDPVSEAHKP